MTEDQREIRRKEGCLPGSWETFAHLPNCQTRTGPLPPGTFRETVLPSGMPTAWHPRVDSRSSIAWRMRLLSTLLDDGHSAPRKTRFRLGASLGQTGLDLQGPCVRFLR